MAYKVSLELSQNVESSVIISKKPFYIFAVGLDSEYLLVYSSKLKNAIGRLSLGEGVSVTCIKCVIVPDLLAVGTSNGSFHFVECRFNNDYSVCELKTVNTFKLNGSINEFRCIVEGETVSVYSAIGTEVRLGRWFNITLDGDSKPKNLINYSKFKIAY